jgi:Fe-S cluster biogenesis protein NfuA
MTRSCELPPPARSAVEAWLDRIRPALVADGGNVELIAIDADGTVRLDLQGACATCPAQLATLRVAIEEPLKKALPGIHVVIAI